MAKLVPFALVTPTAVAFEGEASLVIVNGTEGEIGVLADHSPFSTALKPCVLRADVREDGGLLRKKIAISSGLFQVLPHKIVALVDDAVEAQAVNPEATKADRDAALERQRAAAHDSVAISREQDIIDFANAKLALLAT